VRHRLDPRAGGATSDWACPYQTTRFIYDITVPDWMERRHLLWPSTRYGCDCPPTVRAPQYTPTLCQRWPRGRDDIGLTCQFGRSVHAHLHSPYRMLRLPKWRCVEWIHVHQNRSAKSFASAMSVYRPLHSALVQYGVLLSIPDMKPFVNGIVVNAETALRYG
jgi:hypothetical protein